MDWDDIRYFLSVARAKQFSGAATRMGVDTATIARRISSLEKSLNARLFDRLRTGCLLTQAGERFLATAEELESQILRAQGDLTGSDVDMNGTVRIAAPDGFGSLFLCPRIGDLKAKFPSLTIQLVPISRAFSLSKREADLAVTIERPSEGRLVARKLTDYSLHLYASARYSDLHGLPTSMDDLSNHCLVTYVPDLIFADQLVFIPEVYGPSFKRIECSTVVGQMQAVKGGAGIGVLHDYAADRDQELKVVLPSVVFDRTYWIVTHADLNGLARVRAAIDYILDQVRAEKSIFKRQ
ncbi:LysR family transcriptional regulator [Bradyrhizobium sp. WSM3983]|uniref:LysR family transcriptional regulator n=1 Tax=Bradyrhizobium sp. WSM3983 TaxID=1038867 RepID=UPI000483C5ED|nr:LysR family transcriptional regulator [Bradyrhizobium sp. WSM3983]